MKTSICILISILLASLSSIAQDKIYIWSEIEPGWESRAIDYWANVKGYGKSVPIEMSGLIEDYFDRAEKTLDLKLEEQFISSGITKTIKFSANPGEEILKDSDLFLDLQCMIMETSNVYPNYRSRKLNIEPVIVYKITLFDASGEIVASREIIDKIDYKNKIRFLVRGMSDHRRDIEIVGHSFIESLTGPEIGKLVSQIGELVTQQEEKQLRSDPENFKRVVGLLFENRRIKFPDRYQNINFAKQSIPLEDIETNLLLGRDSTEVSAITDELAALVERGHYYALIIGVNEYNDPGVTDLDEPVKDAQRLFKVLASGYIFDKQYITFLTNPSRDLIIQSMDMLAGKVTEKDNLLIFYAGHGLWDEQLKKGFWLPSNANANKRTNWFSNSDLRDYIGGIKSKHTLLISDACFSGGIFKTRGEIFQDISFANYELYKYPSRKAMTSGNMKTVPDKSVFIDYLIKRLEENTSYSLSSEQLFASFKIAVINNSATNQIPRFGEIRETGDEGGDFLFIRRKK